MGEFGGIISAAVAYRGTREDCVLVASGIEAALPDVPTRTECEGYSWMVLVPFSDDSDAREAVLGLVASGSVPPGQ